jgi:hypothetical protein
MQLGAILGTGGRSRHKLVTGSIVLAVLVVVMSSGAAPALATTDGGVTAAATAVGDTAVTQEDPWININVSDAQGQQGDTVTVTVEVEELLEDRDEENALGYNLLFAYDTEVIEFVEAEATVFNATEVYQDPPTGSGFDPENSGEYGVLRVADMDAATEAAPPFTAVKLRFELVGDPGDETTLEIPAETDGGEELGGVSRNPRQGWPATFESGTVRILEEQAEVGTISGTVTDENGEVVEGAEVRASGTEATTNSDGIYELEVQTGSHELTVSADGYQGESTQVQVEADTTTTQDVELAVAETTDDESEDESGYGETITLLGQGVGLLAVALGVILGIVSAAVRYTDVLD